jgi:phosphoserine phosphatase
VPVIRFRSLVLDVDSTLSAVEGIDYLAAMRGDVVSARVASITDRAMRGEIALEDVYAERLVAVMPQLAEVTSLSYAYVARMEPGAAEALAQLAASGVRIVLVSAGIRDAILPLARAVGVSDADVHAVRVYFTEKGNYAGFNVASPLTQNGGKVSVVRGLGLPRPILAVGDGVTDAELKTADPPAVDAFAAYTGVVAREPVIKVADYTVHNFKEIVALVTGSGKPGSLLA